MCWSGFELKGLCGSKDKYSGGEARHQDIKNGDTAEIGIATGKSGHGFQVLC